MTRWNEGAGARKKSPDGEPPGLREQGPIRPGEAVGE